MTILKRRGSKSDKFNKMNILARSSFVKKHIPETRVCSRETLLMMLNKYGSVYVKPRKGSFGKGIIKVYKSSSGYVVHNGRQIQRYMNVASVASSLHSRINSGNYVVQRAIHSTKFRGRIVDFRVVVQLNGRGQAEVTGIAGRVSQGGRVVSNGGGGGAVSDLDMFFSGRSYYIVKNRLEQVALAVMAQVRRSYSRQTEIGVDLAVDNNLNVWIIEHNYKPDHCMFRNLNNQWALRKIVRYGSIYGKRYRL